MGKLYFSGAFLLLICSLNCYASNTASTPDTFQLYPAINVWGFAAESYVANGQLELPIISDPTKVLFATIEGNTVVDKTGWLLGAGAGYRKIINNRIYGGYAIIDDNKSSLQHTFVVANPGLETLGEIWDARINGYIPLSNKHSVSEERFGDELGKYQYITPQKNQVFDNKFKIYEEIGPGIDAEIGLKIPHLDTIKINGGGYYFHFSDATNIRGAEGRISWQAKPGLAFELRDSYDNYRHNTTQIGIHISFGGGAELNPEKYGIATRLLDPIEHNFATFSDGYATPIRTNLSDLGKQLEYDNVWFFKNPSQYNIQGHGTAEDPYVGIDQNTFNYIMQQSQGKPNTYMWFSTGSYDLSSFTSKVTSLNGRIALPDNYHIWGREIGYQYPAQGNKRPVFLGGIDIDGNYANPQDFRSTALDSIRVQQNPTIQQPYGIFIGSAISNQLIQGINLNNISVGSEATNFSGNFPVGIKITNAQVSLKNSGIIAAANTTDDCFGIYATKTSILNIENSGIAVNAISNTNHQLQTNTQIAGIYATDGTSLNLHNVAIGVNAMVPNSTISGIYASNGAYLEINNLHLGVNTNTSGTSSSTSGIYLKYGALAKIEQSTLAVNAVGSNTNIYGINANYGTALFLNNVRIAIHTVAPNNNIYGIFAKDGVALRANNLDFAINSAGGTTNTYGIYVTGFPITSSNFIVVNSNFNINSNHSAGETWGIYATNGFTDPKYAQALAYSKILNNSFSGDVLDHRVGP